MSCGMRMMGIKEIAATSVFERLEINSPIAIPLADDKIRSGQRMINGVDK